MSQDSKKRQKETSIQSQLCLGALCIAVPFVGNSVPYTDKCTARPQGLQGADNPVCLKAYICDIDFFQIIQNTISFKVEKLQAHRICAQQSRLTGWGLGGGTKHTLDYGQNAQLLKPENRVKIPYCSAWIETQNVTGG